MKLCMSYVLTLKKMLKAVVERFNGILASEGSRSFRRKDWGKRRLAYEIEDFKEGFYHRTH